CLNQTKSTSVHPGPNSGSTCTTQTFNITGLKYAVADAVHNSWPSLTMRFSGTTDNGGTPPGSYGFLPLSTTPSIPLPPAHRPTPPPPPPTPPPPPAPRAPPPTTAAAPPPAPMAG